MLNMIKDVKWIIHNLLNFHSKFNFHHLIRNATMHYYIALFQGYYVIMYSGGDFIISYKKNVLNKK